MNDNAINNFLNSGVGTEKAYYDILNRRSLLDDIGDAYTEQSKQPAVNVNQKIINGFMAGMGAGFKARATDSRNKKLEEIEAKLKQVVEQRTNLQTQLGQRQLTQATFSNFAFNNYGDFKKWNDARGAGDQIGENEIAMGLYNRFVSQNPELADKMGKIDHVMNGKAYFEEGSPVNIKDLIEPLVTTLPEEQQRELSNLTSTTMRNKFSQSDLLEDLSLRDKQAQIAFHNAQANQANAHAEYYRGEANKLKMPSKYSAKTSDFIMGENIKWINNLGEDIKKTDRAAKAYEMTAKILENEKGFTGRGGNSLRAAVQRLVNWEGTESAKNQALLEMYQQPMLEEFKYYFGTKATDSDLKTYLKTAATLDKDSIASIQIANERAAEIRNRNKELRLRAKILEEEFGYGEPYNSQIVNKRVQEELNKADYNDAK